MPYYHSRLSILARLLGVMIAAAAAAGLAACSGGASRPGLDREASEVVEVAADEMPRFASRLIGQPVAERPAMVVELLDPGREPRTRMRFSPKPGTRQRIHSQLRGVSKIEVAGSLAYTQPGLTQQSWVELVVLADRGDGFDCELRVDRAESIDWEKYQPGSLDEVTRSLDRLRGQRHRFTADNRGLVNVALAELPYDLEEDRDLARLILDDAMHPEVVLPSEPIGVGARWRMDAEDVGQTTMTGRAITELELVAVRGRRLELSLSRRLESPPQQLVLRKSILAGMSSGRSTSHGRAVIDLGMLQPIEWDCTTEHQMDGVVLGRLELMPFRARATATDSMSAW
jgi:hypothetical protein